MTTKTPKRPRMVNRPQTPWRLRPYGGPRVLVWKAKHDTVYVGPLMSFDDEDAAYLRVFRMIDREGYYWIADEGRQRDKRQPLNDWRGERHWIGRARVGSARAARRVVDLRSRRFHGYENVYIVELTAPVAAEPGS